MSATSSTSPTPAADGRDFRSNTRPFKRDKDHRSKWENGVRPGAGVFVDNNASIFSEELWGGSESQKQTIRPMKTWSQVNTNHRSHANQTPKPSGLHHVKDLARLTANTEAHFECRAYISDDSTSLSKSLLELLPSHTNNPSSNPSVLPTDSDFLYSFDNKGPSPTDNGRKVDLGGLVDRAEKKWVAEQTDRIVRGEYEVLDLKGEKEVLRKGKKSPKQKAAQRANPEAVSARLEDDDGFELV